ncbi:MAG: hypothetical protein OTI36_01580 [Beijerinckiaceae bacterium]|nr:hypothetical protein [Beijerinckiaceae bacterium]
MALIVLFGVAVALGSELFGAALLLAFAIGRTIPVALGAIAVGWLEDSRTIGDRYRRAFEAAGGATLILSGLYMLNAYYFWIPMLA